MGQGIDIRMRADMVRTFDIGEVQFHMDKERGFILFSCGYTGKNTVKARMAPEQAIAIGKSLMCEGYQLQMMNRLAASPELLGLEQKESE